MQFHPFNSRDINHKKPFGSLAVGESMHFCITMPRDMHCTGVELLLESESRQHRLSLFWRDSDGFAEHWECDFVATEPELLFYHFEYFTAWGKGRISHSDSGLGVFGEGGDWQLTVYSADFTTCEHLKGGIIYQIFPDRFCNSGKIKAETPTDRILRSDWGACPEWRPEPDGEIRNRDYFCGDLEGIRQRLPYLASLSVSCIYLNPIFEAHSNHRYDTANYMAIDPLLGTREDFARLCAEARELNIDIVLDGVFSHTGADSLYFNKNHRYGEGGAYNDANSEYSGWYSFGESRDDYACWWGFETLPEVNENNSDFCEFITGENGVIRSWLREGAAGFRLDVADELPDEFIEKIRLALKSERPDGILIGEVWEDASNKISFGRRRNYLLGSELDSVMNYPFMHSIVDFVTSARAEDFMESVVALVENYPKPVLDCLMNHLGTHDTQRILSLLGGVNAEGWSRERQAATRLSASARESALVLLRAAAALLFALPGLPCIYYGDEAGMEGLRDPFNRGCYPWGREDNSLIEYYRRLGQLRTQSSVFKDGSFVPISAMLGCVAFSRETDFDAVIIISNMNNHPIDYRLPDRFFGAVPLLGCGCHEGCVSLDAKTTAWLACKK